MAKSPYIYFEPDKVGKFANLNMVARHVVEGFISGLPVSNIGVADLQVVGRRVMDQSLEFTATITNSSPTDRVAEAWLQLDGRPAGEPVTKVLKAAGQSGSTGTVRFRVAPGGPGNHFGQVAVSESDDLAGDNVRRFSLDIAPRVRAVIVRGDEPPPAGGMDPAAVLHMALDPYAGANIPWSVQAQAIPAAQLSETSLAGAQVAVFADVPTFTAAQALVVEKFVRAGGTAVFFLGPATNVADYNDRFVQKVRDFGGLLPARLDKAVGQVGLMAAALKAAKNLEHRYLAGLYESPDEYPDVLVQRYYRLAGGVAAAETVLAAPTGEPIVSAKAFGEGRVILFATTASPEWNNLATTPLFLPLLARICLEAGDRLGREHTYPEGAAVTIRPGMRLPARAAVNVTTPDGKVDPLPLLNDQGGPSAMFTRTAQSGIYQWSVAGADRAEEGSRGSFAVNGDGAECDLSSVSVAAVQADISPAQLFSGGTLEEVNAAAAQAAAGENLWAPFVALVILLLVVEAVVANRHRPDPALANLPAG